MLGVNPSDEWYKQLRRDEEGVDVSAGISSVKPTDDEAQSIRELLYGEFRAELTSTEANRLLRRLEELHNNPPETKSN